MCNRARKLVRAAAILPLALIVSACVRADTISSNYGPGYTDSGSAVSVAGSDVGGEYYAVAFTPSTDEIFTDAITDLLWFCGQDTVDAFLLVDQGGLPGASLATLNQLSPIVNGPETFTCFSSCPVLYAGIQYWFELREPDPGTDIGWYVTASDMPVDGNYVQGYTFYTSGTWWPTWPRNVFEIHGVPVPPQNPDLDPGAGSDPITDPIADPIVDPDANADAIPEPSSLLLLLAGLLLLSAVSRTKFFAS